MKELILEAFSVKRQGGKVYKGGIQGKISKLCKSLFSGLIHFLIILSLDLMDRFVVEF